MSWKGQPRGIATWIWCSDTGAARRPKMVSRHSSWCRDMGGSLGDLDMVLVLQPKASLWAEMGSRHGN